MKKILTESQRKALITEREQAIIESFAKTFNSIKRIDENELSQYQTNGDGLIQHVEVFFDNEGNIVRSGSIYLTEPSTITSSNKLVKPIPAGNKGEELRAQYGIGNYGTRNSVDENDHEDWELEDRKQEYGINPDIEPSDVQNEEITQTNNIDPNTTLAYKIIKKICDLLKDDMYVEPDEYGMTTPPLLKSFIYNFDAIDDPKTGKIIGWKRGDIKPFANRAKSYLSNHDIVAINNGSIDVANSNHPEVAKLLVKLDTL